MSIQAASDDWTSDWFFEKARAYPLLDKAEEHAIDSVKWRSLLRTLQLIIDDPAGRCFVQAWARNLLDNPPDVSRFPLRKHYFLLRREHKSIIGNNDSVETLEELAKGHFDELATDSAKAAFLAGSLIPIGFSKVLLDIPESNEISAALASWQESWTEQPPAGATRLQPATAQEVSRALDAYFDARSRLVNHNLRLVFSIARKLEGRQSFEDLTQDGFVGLIRAAEKYNCGTGHRFSTYAYNWIMQSCRRGDEDMSAIIRFPSNIKEQMTAIIKERASFTQSTGKQLSRKQLEERLEIDPASIDNVLKLGNLSISLATPIAGEDGSLTVGDTLVAGPSAEPEQETGQADLKTLFQRRLQALKPLERQVITRRWGLDSAPASTRKQLAHQLSVSVEWIRQVETAALQKLQSDQLLKEASRDFISD